MAEDPARGQLSFFGFTVAGTRPQCRKSPEQIAAEKADKAAKRAQKKAAAAARKIEKAINEPRTG